MNEINPNPPVSKHYPGTLSFYHPNAAGNGSAVRFELKPAIGNREGCFFMELASQRTSATRGADGTRQAATFDWQNKLTVKLGVTDICSLMLVLRGVQAAAGNGKGLYHDTADTSTVIRFHHGGDLNGYGLEVSRKAKRDGTEAVRIRLVLTESEALGLSMIFEQAMMLLVYGFLAPEPAA